MTRIISGCAKGKRLKTLKGNLVRPTSDKVRGAIFNMLGDVVIGADVLDLFSGTGALGIEALSRGANGVVFVDDNPRCISVIKDNLKNTGFIAGVIRGNVNKAIKKLEKDRFGIVFADPPYGKDMAKNLLSQLDRCGILKNFSFVVIEHYKRERIEEPPEWQRVKESRYGDTVISIYRYEKNNRNLSRDI